MITLAMMTLIKDNEGEITKLDKPPSKTVQKHLTNNNNDSSILKLLHKLLPTNNTTLYLFPFSLTELIVPFPMHTSNFLTDSLPGPTQMDLVAVVLHV